jgi:hypothetical protein
MTAGAPLTVAYSYKQNNPLPVETKCELRQNKELVKPLGNMTVQGLPFGGPEATPFPGNFTFDFTVDEPGDYIVQCYTTLDEDNFIEEEITIAPGSGVTPTPVPANEL